MTGGRGGPAEALTELRHTRHRRHRQEIDWIDALYKAYLTVLAGAGFAWFAASSQTGKADPATVAWVAHHGAAALGLAVAAVAAVGLRSGARGGPLSLEGADVRIVLLSPLERRVALRAPAVRQLRSALFAGLCAGALAGNLAGHRLPGSFGRWVGGGVVLGAGVAVGGLAAALLACGARLGRAAASGVGIGLVAWSVGDLTAGTATSPLTWWGRAGLGGLGSTVRIAGPRVAPARSAPVAGGSLSVAVVIAVAAPLVTAVIAYLRLGGMSLEAAERRGRLAAQLRFALSLQDLRTVILLRRRLAAEEPRPRPWLRLGSRPLRRHRRPGGALGDIVRRRCWRSLLRWPATRVARVAALAGVAGVCAAGAWSGTGALIVPAGLALFVAALDATEPLGQEIDHPALRDGYPVPPGRLVIAAIPVAAVVTVAVALLAGVFGVAAGGPAGPMLMGAVPAGVAAVVGAAASLILEPVSAAELMSRYPLPDTAGPLLLLRLAFPPAVAVAGWLPLLAGRLALEERPPLPPESSVVQSGLFVILFALAILSMLGRRFESRRAVPAP